MNDYFPNLTAEEATEQEELDNSVYWLTYPREDNEDTE